MTDIMLPPELSLADLNTGIDNDPRILDIRVAERLGFARPRVIRELIVRNRDELETYGPLAVRHGKSRGQEFTEFWLNEGQTLLVCMFSKTPDAAAIRKEVIAVYMAWRRGEVQHGRRRGVDLAGQRRALTLIDQLKRETSPTIRRTLHAMLGETLGAMGIATPALDEIGREIPPPPDIISIFWQQIATLQAQGISINHARDPYRLALHLPTLRDRHGIDLSWSLRAALKRDPRFIAVKAVNSALTGQTVKCWVFTMLEGGRA